MIHGETVSVSLRYFNVVDEYGNEVEEYGEEFLVPNVLVGKPETRDRIEDGQPYAISADKRFCFPRGFRFDLRGARIRRMGATYKVVGEPMILTDANVPPNVPWNLYVEAVRFDG